MSVALQPSYVPLLTGKRGEFDALRSLPATVRAALRPILDLPPIRDADDPVKVIESLLRKIGGVSRNDGAIAVDLLALEGRLANGLHPIEYLLSRADWCAASVQLAVRTDATEAYVQAAAKHHKASRGVCVRARVDEDTDAQTLSSRIDEVLDSLNLARNEVHLCWDCGSVASWVRRPDEILAEQVAVTPTKAFRLTSVAATSVPSSAEIDRDARPMRVQRREWRAWRRLRAAGIDLVFGDYGITGPRPTSPASGSPDPHLRYTTNVALLIWRGRRSDRVSEDDEGLPVTFGDLCRELVQRDDFAGAAFSPGDAVFSAVADRTQLTKAGLVSDGNTSQWVEWATSHHIVHVYDAVSR